MIEASAVGRAGTPDKVATVGALLMGPDGGFITGSDILMDGGVIAAYWYSRPRRSPAGLARRGGVGTRRRVSVVAPLLPRRSGVAGFVVLAGFLELVFEDDDPAGCVQGGALVYELAGPGGQAELVAGVPAMATG